MKLVNIPNCMYNFIANYPKASYAVQDRGHERLPGRWRGRRRRGWCWRRTGWLRGSTAGSMTMMVAMVIVMVMVVIMMVVVVFMMVVWWWTLIEGCMVDKRDN